MPEPITPSRLHAVADWIVPVSAVGMVFVMLVPLPAMLLDFLLAISITLSVLVLLSALHILRPVQFSVFPTLLLLLTLFRLSLNIASSRRILLHGNEGPTAAGDVIAAFGQFVVGGNYVVGFVIFLALIAIQFLVVNHGAVRTAEVTARFTLDAMPGKQMAIDADLNSGLIDEKQARTRRDAVAKEAEFYGAMDGAARFNQRDALATILITALNIIAGFLIGVFQLGIPFSEALRTYTILTVGDGLVTMIPSLLVSVAGGMVVTRASSDAGLGSDLGRQLFAQPRALWIAAGIMGLLALVPGLPKIPFLALCGAAAYLARRRAAEAQAELLPPEPKEAEKSTSPAESLERLLKLDEIALEIGYGLIPLVDEKQGGQLLRRIRAIRKHLAMQLGFVVPSVHITDNPQLQPREYVVHLRGVEIARWQLHQDCLLAISSDAAGDSARIDGKDTVEPAFRTPAKWITPAQQEQALAAGFAVVDQTSVIATHLAELIRCFAHELLTRTEVKRLLDTLSESHPKLVEELVPRVLTLGEVHKALQLLLREQVSIRDLSTILEVLLDTAATNKSPAALVEAVRQALSRSLVRPLLGENGQLNVVTLAPELEEELYRALQPAASKEDRAAMATASPAAAPQISFARRLLEGLRSLIGEPSQHASPVLLCAAPLRFHLRNLIEPFWPRAVVLSRAEIPGAVVVQSVGVVR